jgi:exonuclease III
LIRSGWLQEICDRCNLTDPFRALNYNKRGFTFVPRTGARNRSRLDFFLISDDLLRLINKCTIADSLDSNIFDHKHIKLDFCVTLSQPDILLNQ